MALSRAARSPWLRPSPTPSIRLGRARAEPHSQTTTISVRPASTSPDLYSIPDQKRNTAVFFPGHGVQRVGMLQPWLQAFPRTVKPMLDQVDQILEPIRPKSQPPLSDIIANGPNTLLARTENAQPAIMATSVLILRVLEAEFGFDLFGSTDYTLGHSLGEFSALVAGGYLSFDQGVWLVQKRATAMADATAAAAAVEGAEEMGMVALVCENEERLRDLLTDLSSFVTVSSAIPGLSHHPRPPAPELDDHRDTLLSHQVQIANINSKTQIVLSGSIVRIKRLVANLRQFGGHDPRAVRLMCDAPFHSNLMQPACDAMRHLLAENTNMLYFPESDLDASTDVLLGKRLDRTSRQVIPCISNITARPFHSAAQQRDLLARQCVETVNWWASVQYLDRFCHVGRWIGIGPGKVGRNLVGKEVGYTGRGAGPGQGVWAVTSPQEAEETVRALERIDRDG